MWPFSRRSKKKATPPVDLNVAVTNPGLVEAINAFAKKPNDPQLNALLNELTRANFLIATLMDEAHVTPGVSDGSATIKEGSQIRIFELGGPNDERFLALFTDWDAIRKFTQEPASALVTPARDAWSFAAEKYAGAVVNPAGRALPLDAEQVRELARMSQPT